MKKLMFYAIIVALGAGVLQAEDAYLESSGGTGINSRYFFNPKSRVEVDYALTDASIAQARVWGMDATSPMASLYVQGTLNVAFGSGDTFVNSDTATGLRADTLRHTAILDVANRQAVYMTGTTTNWSNLAISASHAPSTTATVPLAIFAGTSNNKAGTLFYNYAKMNHHGCPGSHPKVWVGALSPKVWVGAVWHQGHADPYTFEKLGGSRSCATETDLPLICPTVYPSERRIAAILQKAPWLPQVVPASFAGGHVVVTVPPGGKTFTVRYIDAGDVKMNVLYEKEMVS